MPNILIISPDNTSSFINVKEYPNDIFREMDELQNITNTYASIGPYVGSGYTLTFYYQSKDKTDKINQYGQNLLSCTKCDCGYEEREQIRGNLGVLKYINGKWMDVTWEDFINVYNKELGNKKSH